MPNTRRRSSFEPGRASAFVEYATVKAKLAVITDSAVLLAGEKASAWLPRFRLDAPSRALIYRSAKGDEVTLQIELQTALDKGLV